MTATAIADAGSTSLLGQISGMNWSPRATLERVAVRPAWFGMLLVPIIVTSAANLMFLSTSVGQRTLLEPQIGFIEDFGPATLGALGRQ